MLFNSSILVLDITACTSDFMHPRVRLGDLGGQATGPRRQLQRLWKCWL